MSERLYTPQDIAAATERPLPTVQYAVQRAKVGHMCNRYRRFTEAEYQEILRVDKIAKEQKAEFSTLLLGIFANRGEMPFPYITLGQAAELNGIHRSLVSRWVSKGVVPTVSAGKLDLLGIEGQELVKKLAAQAKEKFNRTQVKSTTDVIEVAIDRSVIKFSITREGAKKLLEYLKQQLGEA